jgi:glycosyltransferase involved in cell wall biosynthesis
VACSATAARSLTRGDPRLITKTRVLYSPLIEEANGAGVPRPLPSESNDQRRLTVGFVGRVTEAKGIHVLLKAVTRLPAELRERLQVLLVGEPAPGSAQDRAYHARLRSCAAAWGLDDKILWAGYQAHLGPYYSAMDVLVAPSLLPEGLHLGILEAMHHGVPVIASRSGGILETVRDGVNGLLVSPGDERALALALERVLTSSSLRAQLAQGALTTVDDRFSVETFKRGVREVVLKLHSPVASAGCTVNPEESTVRP